MQPDAVALVVSYLRGQEHLAGVTVVTARPHDITGPDPVLLVEPVGDPVRSRMPWARRERWHLGLHAWAPEGEATVIAYGALTALAAAWGVCIPDAGRIVRADPSAGPHDVPDGRVGDGVRRAVATFDVVVRP
ncbi:hypothetical protein ACQEVZ_39850 [Dactylosporangium sp. CA-152071]|uniref:hypothetical protein n=1 Tax=Dactylosporangium sp. CA-152071 TaxID=3239933 RepID=UPI003D92C0ED